jgi:DUF4097 and DUF4098 domain-containing protein YvlB
MFHYKIYVHPCIFMTAITSTLWAFDPLAWFPTSWVAHQREQTSLTYPLTSQKQVTVTIDHGFVSLDTWSHQNAALHITKKGRSHDAVKNIHTTINETAESIDIIIEQPEEQTAAEVALIVPATLHVTIICQQDGDISVANAPHHLKVSTQEGTITIESVHGETVDSYTEHGNIMITCASFTENSSILARAPNGAVTLRCGEKLNAELDAKSYKGSVSVTFPFTIEKMTFPHFDKHQVTKMSKKIQGTIGSGGPLISIIAKNDIIITHDV